jgi:hypothetical protein
MGYNGSSTYGVRVDSAKNADTVGGELPSAFANATHSHDYVSEGGTSFTGTYPMVARIGASNFYSNDSITYTGATNTLSCQNVDAGDFYTDGVRQPKTTVSTSAPTSPATNDIWIDTN